MAIKISTENNQIVFTNTVTTDVFPYPQSNIEARYTDTEVYFINTKDAPNIYPFSSSLNNYKVIKFAFADVLDSDSVSLANRAGVQTYLSDKTGFNTSLGGSKEFQVIVNQANVATTLGGTIDSDKEYFIDGVIDCTGVEIEVPETGMELRGYSFDTSMLACTDDNYTMFNSPVGGSGNLLITDLGIETSGTSSKVFELTDIDGTHAVEINKVNFNDCTSRGSLTEYRQGLENGNGYFGGTPELEMIGVWLGGYRMSASIARNVGSSILFKAGTGLVLNNRFFVEFNMEGETNASFCDFAPANIDVDGEFEVLDGDYNGVTDPFPNMSSGSVKARFRNNLFLSPNRNTYVGSRWTITTSALTTISSSNTPVKVAGTTTYEDEQWFTNTTDNAFVYESEQEIEFIVNGIMSFSGGNNDQVNIIIRQWDDSASAYIDISPSNVVTLNGGGGSRAEGVSILAFGTIFKDDRIEVWIENQTDSSNITAELGGLISIQERAN